MSKVAQITRQQIAKFRKYLDAFDRDFYPMTYAHNTIEVMYPCGSAHLFKAVMNPHREFVIESCEIGECIGFKSKSLATLMDRVWDKKYPD